MGGGECFTPWCKVTLANGNTEHIAALAIGDLVQGETSINRILQTPTFRLADNRIHGFNDNAPFVTCQHPIKTDHGWACFDPEKFKKNWPDEYDEISKANGGAVYDLKEGDKVLLGDGTYSLLTHHVMTDLAPDFLVYNLTVSGDHTFIAEGVVVHNKGGNAEGGESVGSDDDTDVATSQANAEAAQAAADAGVNSQEDADIAAAEAAAVAENANPDIDDSIDFSSQESVNRAIARGMNTAAQNSTIGLISRGLAAFSDAVGLGAHGTNTGQTDPTADNPDINDIGGPGENELNTELLGPSGEPPLAKAPDVPASTRPNARARAARTTLVPPTLPVIQPLFTAPLSTSLSVIAPTTPQALKQSQIVREQEARQKGAAALQEILQADPKKGHESTIHVTDNAIGNASLFISRLFPTSKRIGAA